MTRVALGALIVVLLVVFALFVFIPPGESDRPDDTVPPVTPKVVAASAWAAEVCPKLHEYDLSISTGATPPTSASTQAQRQEVQSYFVELLERSSLASDALARDVAAAGTPDVSSGRSLAEDLRRALLRAETDLSEARDELGLVPLDDEGEFRTGIVATAGSIQSALTPYGEAVSAIAADAELGPVVEGKPGCAPS